MIKRTKIRSNGITFFYEQDLSAGSVTAALFFKAGVLWEKPREYGVTRFVSRLLFRGLTAGAPDELAFSLREGRDHAAFLCTAPKERAGETVSALARLFDTPFDAASVEGVRRETLREIAAYAPTKSDKEERLYFERESYAVPLMGTAETVGALTAEQLERYRGLWFARSNACFVLTGGFSDGQGKEIEAFLRELPVQKHKNPNVKPTFPEEQFFRTSASDRLIPTDGDRATVTLLFDVDLCETKPVYADLLLRLLTDPEKGAVGAALRRQRLTDDLRGELRLYIGFAVLALSFGLPHDKAADGIAAMADALAECKEKLTEELAAPFFGRYRENRLYRRGDGDRAYDIGLHNYIIYTDDIVLPEGNADAVMERLQDAADHILIPDNAKFLVYYNEKQGADLAAVRRSVAAARVRLFV